MLKYNVINNFVNSIAGNYSSPYLLKNTLSSASQRNDIYVNSVPLMHPVTSDNIMRWLGGGNVITGSPSSSGLNFDENAYPDMDEGYNYTSVGASNYISGNLYSMDLSVTMNSWGEVPNPAKFAVSGGSVIYEPYLDGLIPTPDYYELTDIGFGLYDTVYVDDLGDSPGARDIFMQAVMAENQGQYSNAINLYKQVITSFRASPYAAVSVSRIFNCYEKKRSGNIDYQNLQNYMIQIKNNSNLSNTLKGMAEDYVIKAKVRMGMLQSAINDYEAMYQQNQNNHKGIHALLNKEILIQMLNDTNDNPNGNNKSLSLKQHKQNLISMILGQKLTELDNKVTTGIPKEFRLYQNYPNPFNPLTKIRYDIPMDADVSIKIYDILGKELHSFNEFKKAGSYEFIFDGSNYASGLYIYRLESGSFIDTKKMVLVK